MPIYLPPRIPASEITPRSVYLKRRDLLTAAALIGLSTQVDAAPLSIKSRKSTVSDEPTPREDVTSYNNFYEFGTNKSDPAEYSGKFKPSPWTIEVDGLVARPGTFDLEQIIRDFPRSEEHTSELQ